MRTQEEILQGEQLHTFLMKCSMDFKLWCNRVIQDPTDHSKGLSIQPFHMEWFNSVHTKPRSCIRAPREHGKTLLLGAAYPLWVVFFNQFKEILIVSNTLEQSTKVLEVIKETIRQNKLLDKLIPVDKDATWSKTEIHTSTRCKIFCKPNNDNIRGSHVNYVICVPGNTSIETINGSKKISEIKIGDYVKTYRDRFKQVLKVMKRDSSEKILEIIAGENKLKITKNHPILVRRNKILKWVPAGKIQMSDRLCYPLRGKIKSLRIPRRGVKKLSDYIMVNEDVGRLFGLFAAEGSLGKSMIRLTFNSKEINFIEETQRLIENNFKVKTNLDKHNSWATTVYSCSVALKKLFLNNFGSNSKERKVPNIILNSPNSVKACFVKGWLDGDGTHGKGSILGSTISKELCEGIGKLSNDLGFLPKLTFVKNAKSKNKIYNLYFDANSVRKLNTLASIKKHRRFFYIPIKQISWVRNCSRLYNIEVLDDNSYIANGIVVHNCDEPATYREKDVFWRVITPTVQIKKGNICVIGTPESEYDLLADIMKNPAYDSKTYKAEYMEKGVKKVLWPEKFTIDRLEKLKEEIGIDAYKKEYLCDPIPDKTQVFQSKWIHEATNYDIGFSQPEDGGLYYIGADFAMSRGKKAEYRVICLLPP